MTGAISNIETPAPSASRWRVLAICLVLAAITFAVFAGTVRDDFVNFDDPEYVLENPMVSHGVTAKGIAWAFTHVHSSNWHPLTWISHMVDCQLYGLNPAGHHLTNVLIHCVNVILLFLVLRQMTGALWPSAFVVAIFAVHPLRVESVAWVSERKDVLSGLFFMLTLAAYVRYARRPQSMASYALVMLAFALGLLCKPMLVTLPIILLLLDYWPLRRAEPVKRLIFEKMPLLALSAASCLVTLFAQSKAMKSVEVFPLSSRIISALLACRIYLLQMFYPAGLSAFYPFPRQALIWDGVMAGVLLAVISAFAWGERRTRPWFLTGWVWYLVMLLPVVGIVQVGGQAHADRYTYLPQIGLYVVLAWFTAELGVKWRLGNMAIGSAMAAVVALLMWVCWTQASYWRTSETLWRHALECKPDNNLACVNLGHYLFKERRYDEAIALYKSALEREPNAAEFHNNLGNALREKGQTDEALVQYQRAAELKPSFADAQFNLAKILSLKGKSGEAIVRFKKALELDPSLQQAHIDIGNELLKVGQPDQAAAQFQNLLASRPEDPGVHLDLGLSFYQMGRMADAKSEYETALRLNPADPGTASNLAWLLATCPMASLRDGTKAVEIAAQANQLSGGNNPIILHTLAAAFAEAGRFQDAQETAQRAAGLAAQANPDLAAQLKVEIKRYQTGRPLHSP